MTSNAVDLLRQAGPSFKRGQVAQGLWSAFSGPAVPRPAGAVPKTFARRVAKLIELGVPFDASQRPGRPGIDLEFSLADVAELGVALDLQDLGLNQGEVAQWVRANRRAIRAAIDRVVPGKDLYFLIRSRAVALPALHRGNPFGPEGSTIGEPVVVEDAAALGDALRALGGSDRKRIVIEVGTLVEHLSISLPMAVLTRRGRQ
jgi:hypothetical protein